jgi:hypothetical protein
MKKGDLFRLLGAACLGLGLLGSAACSPEGSGTDSTSAGAGGKGGDTGGAGGSGGSGGGTTGGAGGSTTGGAGGGAGGAGGGTADGACPVGAFPAANQLVIDSSSTPMMQDTVWTKDNLYLVKTDLEVRALLTIEAGTTVCFDASFSVSDFIGIHIGDQLPGSIRIQGTSDEHVTLTAIDPGKGWHGVHVSGEATEVDLAYTDFFFASRADPSLADNYSIGALRVRDIAGDPAPVTRLHHVTFSGAKRGGPLQLEADAGLTADSVVLVTAFDLAQDDLEYTDAAVLVSPEAASSLFPGMLSIAPEVPEPTRGIEILDGGMSADSTLRSLGVPFFVHGYLSIGDDYLLEPRTMTIEAGVEVRLGYSAAIQAGSCPLGGDGNLIVDGTAQDPVKLVYYPFPGDVAPSWGALVFRCYDPAVSRVSHAILQSAGGNGFAEVYDACGDNSSTGAIVLDHPDGLGGGTDYPSITIDHTTIDGSLKNGIVAECNVACIDPAIDYMDPALGNVFLNIAGQPQILATCP